MRHARIITISIWAMSLMLFVSTSDVHFSSADNSTSTPMPGQTTLHAGAERTDSNGIKQVNVPAGCFMMGTDNPPPSDYDDEKPATKICFDQPFWIDQTEVTQAQFKQFGGRATTSSFFPGDNRPVETVTWFEARDFCVTRGARLPTEAEWEYAARGSDNLIYPWGNDWDSSRAVWGRLSSQGTANVGSIPAGASWVGALDMIGNVWEWVSTIYQPYPYSATDGRENTVDPNSPRVFRGGSWSTEHNVNLRALLRGGTDPRYKINNVGFRCASSIDQRPFITPTSINGQWKPVLQQFDGVSMMQVPVGCFIMGTEYPPSWDYNNEKPTTKICFDQPFWIDQTEVTQAQFKQFGGRATTSPYFPGDNRPVESVTWFEARDFCVKRGARLPTEAEWEYAARGPDNLVYPWGNDWDSAKAVWVRFDSQGTANVGSLAAGASWVGALDMIGNVSEWVNTIYQPYPYNATDERESAEDTTSPRVQRGGSWNEFNEVFLRPAFRYWVIPSSKSDANGLRCAHS